MTLSVFIGALSAALALSASALAAPPEPKPVRFVVLLESGAGGTRAQSYLDQLLGLVADRCAWPAVASRYLTRKDAALDYIKSDRPELGLFSLGAYLALKDTHQLEVIGQAHSAAAGGRRYFVVSKAEDLAACKGQPLASNHLADPRFVDHVLFRGKTRLADYVLVDTPRPVQTLKAVIRDEARCALIDDAQLAQLPSIEDGKTLRTVWQSEELPPMPIVALPNAPREIVTAFQKAMPSLCSGDDAEVCKNVGLQGLAPAGDAAYAPLVALYRGNEIAKP